MVKKKEDVEDYSKTYEANENALVGKDKTEVKQMMKEGTLTKCSGCEYVRYSVYMICPKCGHKEEANEIHK